MAELSEHTPIRTFVDPAGGDIYVIRICPTCGRFITTGGVSTDQEGDNVRLARWLCKQCGEVKPDWSRV